MNIKCRLFGHDYVFVSGKSLPKPRDDMNPDLMTWVCKRCNKKKQEVWTIWEVDEETLSTTSETYSEYLKQYTG